MHMTDQGPSRALTEIDRFAHAFLEVIGRPPTDDEIAEHQSLLGCEALGSTGVVRLLVAAAERDTKADTLMRSSGIEAWRPFIEARRRSRAMTARTDRRISKV
jgi:hypothetical protein